MLKNKWKRFAINNIFSEWNDAISADDIFDDMQLENEQGMAELFDDADVIVWEPFENWPLTALAEYALQLAETAQQTEYEI